ncbi:MAG: hypothetical protein AAB368_02805, partial [bacterium]
AHLIALRPAPPAATRFVWSAGALTMGPGSVYTFTVTGQVSSVCLPTTVSNTAIVTASSACVTQALATNQVQFSLTPPPTAVSAGLTQIPAAPGRGGDVRYQIVVTNMSTSTVTSLTVVDTIPTAIPRWTIATEQPLGFGLPVLANVPLGGTRFEWSAGGLALGPGMSFTFTVWGTVAEVCSPTNVSNTAFVIASSACGASDLVFTNGASFDLSVPALAYTAVKTQTPASGATLNPGDPVTYRIDVTNTGSATLRDLAVADTVTTGIASATTVTPSAFLQPVVAAVVGGTRFVWSGGPLTWATAAPMPTARTYLAVQGMGGLLYAIGGFDGTLYRAEVEAFDPGTGTWTTKAPLLTARYGPGTGVIAGRLHVVGGFNGAHLGTHEVYDPATNTWVTKAVMPTPRNRLAAGVVSGRLYAIGGFNGASQAVVHEYDPASDTWVAKLSMPTARRELSAVVVNGLIYAIGGTGAGTLATVEVYNP